MPPDAEPVQRGHAFEQVDRGGGCLDHGEPVAAVEHGLEGCALVPGHQIVEVVALRMIHDLRETARRGDFR